MSLQACVAATAIMLSWNQRIWNDIQATLYRESHVLNLNIAFSYSEFRQPILGRLLRAPVPYRKVALKISDELLKSAVDWRPQILYLFPELNGGFRAL
jgi:hypothetical protein